MTQQQEGDLENWIWIVQALWPRKMSSSKLARRTEEEPVMFRQEPFLIC
jgi:hypothetical protein